MDKSKIYINLTKCTEEERKSLPQILKKANEDIYEMSEKMLNSGLLIDEDGDDSYILLSKSLKNEWVAYLKSGCDNKTELTYIDFIKLFEGGESKEVLQVENNGSAVDFFEPYELEFIDFLLNKDFEENNKDFSYGKIKKVKIIMNKIKSLRLR